MKNIKYPRTYHLPWSKGITSDDKVLVHFHQPYIVVTEKMDGENMALGMNFIHSRSVNPGNLSTTHRESQTWIKNFWGNVRWKFNKNYIYFIENMYAQHSIQYNNLDTYAYLFSILDVELMEFIAYNDVESEAKRLGFSLPTKLYEGVYNEELLIKLTQTSHESIEGYIVRYAFEFAYDKFHENVAKYVRPNHVAGEHWSKKLLIKNKLKK